MKKIKPIKVRGKLDPRRALFLAYYLNPDGETFSNAFKSAVKAGYDDEYSRHILTQDWVCENIRYDRMIVKAEKVLEDCLEIPVDKLEWQGRGEDAEQVMVTDSSLVKIKQDTAKFVAERLGKFGEKSTIDLKGEGLKEIATTLKRIADRHKNK